MMLGKLSIAFCESNRSDQDRLVAMLRDAAIPSDVTLFTTGEDLLRSFRPFSYDLIILAIGLDDMCGVEVVRRIREVDPGVVIAFASSAIERASDGYRLDVVKFLEKPVRQEALEDTLLLAKVKKEHVYSIKARWYGHEQDIPISDITYIEQNGHKMRIVLSDGTELLCYDRVSNYYEKLGQRGFYSGHRSYLVNLNYVEAVDRSLRAFMMADGPAIPIRRTSLAEAARVFERHRRGLLESPARKWASPRELAHQSLVFAGA